jgi:6-phosphogluconolactonase
VHDGEHVQAHPQVDHLADVRLGEGAWPRHHEVVACDGEGDLLVVALQGTSELVSVRVPASGSGEVLDRASWASPPSCVVVEP